MLTARTKGTAGATGGCDESAMAGTTSPGRLAHVPAAGRAVHGVANQAGTRADAARRWITLTLWLAASALGESVLNRAAAEDIKPGPESACPKSAVRLYPGSDIAAVVQRSKEGTSFCLAAGVHRIQAITPRNNQRFYGEAGAVLSGARLLTRFAREGRHWVASGQNQREWHRADVPCVAAMPRCGFPEAVFIDNRPLVHAASRSEVEDGKFFFDYDSRKIYFSIDPKGHKVEASVSPFAFRGGAHGILIAGLIIEKYSTENQHGAIGGDVNPEDWIVQDNEIRLNSAVGVAAGTRSRIRHNYIHSNGNLGARCAGNDILFDDNEISENGYFRGVVPLWEGGGVKCLTTRRLTFRGNRVVSNNGIGLWTDYDNWHTLYENNVLLNNRNSGISHEISYDAVIRNNFLLGNGDAFNIWLWGGAILLQNSQRVRVYDNTIVTYDGNGISLIQQNRGSGTHGPFNTIENRIFDNIIVSMKANSGRSGAVADFDREGLERGKNVFQSNTYFVPDARGAHWTWVDGNYNWSDYRVRSGQEIGSNVRQLAERFRESEVGAGVAHDRPSRQAMPDRGCVAGRGNCSVTRAMDGIAQAPTEKGR